MVLKIVPKAGHELNQLNHESTNEREGKPEQKCDTAFGIILKLVIFFKEQGDISFVSGAGMASPGGAFRQRNKRRSCRPAN